MVHFLFKKVVSSLQVNIIPLGLILLDLLVNSSFKCTTIFYTNQTLSQRKRDDVLENHKCQNKPRTNKPPQKKSKKPRTNI